MAGSDLKWYLLQVAIYIFAAGIVADLVQVINLSVTDTYFRQLPGGTYYTLKYSSLQWALLLLTNVKLLMPVVALMAILFRKKRGCSIFWFTLVAAIWLISVVVVFGLGQLYSEANRNGQRDNIFTDPLYCCAPEIFTEPANHCPNTGACTCPPPPMPCPPLPTTRADLHAWQDASARFWVDFVYMLYHTGLLIFFAIAFFYPSPGKRTNEAKKYN